MGIEIMEVKVRASADRVKDGRAVHSSWGELKVTMPSDGTVCSYGFVGLSCDAMFKCDMFSLRPCDARVLATALLQAADLAEKQTPR